MGRVGSYLYTCDQGLEERDIHTDTHTHTIYIDIIYARMYRRKNEKERQRKTKKF